MPLQYYFSFAMEWSNLPLSNKHDSYAFVYNGSSPSFQHAVIVGVDWLDMDKARVSGIFIIYRISI